FLDRQPHLIDSKFFSPQNRTRCYWGNIPGMYQPIPQDLLAKSYPLSDCIANIGERTALAEKVNCITTNSNSLKPVIRMNNHTDFPWITEIEQIFGFPKHYTDVGNLSMRERQAVIGRSWSVGVIEYLLKPLTKYYPTKNSVRNGKALSVNGNQGNVEKNKVSRTFDVLGACPQKYHNSGSSSSACKGLVTHSSGESKTERNNTERSTPVWGDEKHYVAGLPIYTESNLGSAFTNVDHNKCHYLEVNNNIEKKGLKCAVSSKRDSRDNVTGVDNGEYVDISLNSKFKQRSKLFVQSVSRSSSSEPDSSVLNDPYDADLSDEGASDF
ncbi:DNA (cytosine-5)-methyltransferase 3A, partial [Halocaridina rubra]